MYIKDKKMYIWLVGAIFNFIILIIQIFQANYDHVWSLGLTVIICIYFFIKFNTRSAYLNPDHPNKPEKQDTKNKLN